MNPIRDGLRAGSITLGIFIFLVLIGIPQAAGGLLWPLFALLTLLLTAVLLRRGPHASRPARPWPGALATGALAGLIAGVGLAALTFIVAREQARGVNFQPVLDKIRPETTAALLRLPPQPVAEGAPLWGALLALAGLLILAGLCGGLLERLWAGGAGSTRWPAIARSAAARWAMVGLPFSLAALVIWLRAPGVNVGGDQEQSLQLLLVFVLTGTALFSLRAVESVVARRVVGAALVIVALALPRFLDQYQMAVLGSVAIYIIMGLGLNIVVGYAGLLDLGYVAFFAIGAYTYGMLSAPRFFPDGGINFWTGIPLALGMAAMLGAMLGIPVLRMRGDYLAIVTLGFGEIIRLLLVNLRDVTGGPHGLLKIPSPYLFGIDLGNPRGIFYLGLAGAMLAMLAANRLNRSRLGRAWGAMREDEDVAQAIGVNLVRTKLLAFAAGAAFAGIAGALYAARQINIFPDNFTLFVSVNVLSLLVIGGMGRIEGVILGAVVLIGLPELLRGADEYRIMLFGAMLVAMMVLRPEGLVPSAQLRRELRETEDAPAES